MPISSSPWAAPCIAPSGRTGSGICGTTVNTNRPSVCNHLVTHGPASHRADQPLFAERRRRRRGASRGAGSNRGAAGPRSTFYSSRHRVCVCPCGKRARRSGLPAMLWALGAPEVHFVTLADCTNCESAVPTGIVLTFVRARIRRSVALHAARMLLTRLALGSHECGFVFFHVLLPSSCYFFDGALCVDSRLNRAGT